ncbi:hypothetical protein Tsp_05064 [Trichinella spiralis]|uniref:hypothetical protein n=1 Tax=Trichinella spiralis TaxID=6334 RepID=UPI0001EFECF6|nr:hypothetical protein Tsp_05064 [Trichinella spiralis]
MASLPESSSVITPSGTGFAGCFPPGSAPNRKPVFSSPSSPPFRKELLTVVLSVIPLRVTTSIWLPFRIVDFDSREAHVGAASQQLKREQRVTFVDLVFHEYQRSGIEVGLNLTKCCLEFLFIEH